MEAEVFKLPETLNNNCIKKIRYCRDIWKQAETLILIFLTSTYLEILQTPGSF